MDDELREQLEQQLYEKMEREHGEYLAGVKTWPPMRSSRVPIRSHGGKICCN